MDDRSVKEELKQERKKLRELPTLGKKLEYIWDYYKPVMVIVVLVIAAVVTVFQIIEANKVEPQLNIAMANASSEAENIVNLPEEFSEYLGITDKYQEISVDSSYQMNLDTQDSMSYTSIMKMAAVIASKELDVMVVPEDIFEYYARQGAFVDLAEFLPEEDYEKYKNRISMAAEVTESEMDESGEMQETFGEEKAYGLDVTDCEKLSGCFYDEKIVMAVMETSTYPENALKFVQYILP